MGVRIKTTGHTMVSKIKPGQTFLYKGEKTYMRVTMDGFNSHWNEENPNMIPAVCLQDGLFCVFHPDTKVLKVNLVAELKIGSKQFSSFLYDSMRDGVE